MALPDYSYLTPGATITWTSSGGDKVLTLTSKANNVGCEGDKSGTLVDGTLGMPEVLECRLESQVGSAATNGLSLDCYFGESDNATAGTNNPGNLTGAAADVSNPDELKVQCYYGGSLPFSNARGTNVQKTRFLYYPTQAYIIPFLVNKTGQTLGSTGTNHKLVVTPFYRRIAD